MMVLRPGKLLLIALIPLALYGAAKGLMYYKAKIAMDDIVAAASNVANIRYAGIATEISGAVTVQGITVEPRGYTEGVQIDAVRLASKDPMFFIREWDWQPGKSEPPDHLAVDMIGMRLSLDSALLDEYRAGSGAPGAAEDACIDGPSMDPQLLKQLGFTEVVVDVGGHYRLDRDSLTMDAGWRLDVQDLQSMELSIEMSDVDTQTLSKGAPPQMNLSRLRVAVDVSPAFGAQALKACAVGTDLTVDQWSERYANRFIQGLADQGVSLGSGLQRAVRDYYREWGTVEIVAAPSQPVGLLSLAFLPPNQLADALALRLMVNEQPVTDTRFTWNRSDAPGLSALFSEERDEVTDKPKARPKRVIVRREFEPVAKADLATYVDSVVRLKPQGQPLREGLLRRIRNGEAEVEQNVHGGKLTVYVPLNQIVAAEALVQREVKKLP